MRPPFSTRLPWERPENTLAALERGRRERGEEILDLTVSNPTAVGLPELGARVTRALAEGESGPYEPAPAGAPAARAAIAAETSGAGATPVAPEQVLLTASSSESYAFLFKVLCDPGDAVLVPEPSYPLFEYLARLDGVEPVPYRLAYDGAWHVDLGSVDDALARAGGRARALVVVNPNNPTGSFLKRFELPALAARCEAHGLAVIADEVFSSYAAGDDPTRVRALAAEPTFTDRALTFALGGLSKACALPQLKLGWMTVAGPPGLAREARERLELVADTYLSVNAPVQQAAARLLAIGRDARAAIAARVADNRVPRARGAAVVGLHGARARGRLVRDRARARDARRRRVGRDAARRRRRARSPRVFLRPARRRVPRAVAAAGARRLHRGRPPRRRALQRLRAPPSRCFGHPAVTADH